MDSGQPVKVVTAEELYEAAFARLAEGATQEAAQYLQRAVTLAPEQPKYATALAKVYEILGQREQAGAWLDRALGLRRRAMKPR